VGAPLGDTGTSGTVLKPGAGVEDCGAWTGESCAEVVVE
jgi:hypothetical protein